MDKIHIIPATTDSQIQEIADLAAIIWQEHFTPIIGPEQVTYMLDKFQSYPAISGQIRNDGYQYYQLTYDGILAGYSGIRLDDDGLFLSKLYIHKDFRGRKISSAVLNFYTELCKSCRSNRIWLTCNRNNTDTLAVYQKLGFKVIETKAADIGNGFVMDDYILEKNLSH